MTKITLTKCYETQDLGLPDELTFELKEDTKKIINQTLKYMTDNKHINKMCVESEVIFKETPYELETAYGQLRIGVDYVTVFPTTGLYYELQCKYDSGNQAEYEFNI